MVSLMNLDKLSSPPHWLNPEVSEDLGVHYLPSPRTELFEGNLDSPYAAFLFHFEQGILLSSAYVYFCISTVWK
jgi:hypothetical protein